MNCWNLSKLGAAWFHLQLGSLEIDLNIYIYCSRLWPFGPLVRWSTTSSSSLAACIKLLPVLTSTRVEDYSSAAVPRRGSLHTAPFLISSMWSPSALHFPTWPICTCTPVLKVVEVPIKRADRYTEPWRCRIQRMSGVQIPIVRIQKFFFELTFPHFVHSPSQRI